MLFQSLYFCLCNENIFFSVVGMIGSKTNFDENKLVLHKYSDIPSSAQEAKQCSAGLSLSQLKQIECSFKSIDFGCVSPNSISTKSLTLVNGINGSIAVRLEGTYQDYNHFYSKIILLLTVMKSSAISVKFLYIRCTKHFIHSSSLLFIYHSLSLPFFTHC